MFIQTEETPNPTSLKFLPGQEVLSQGHSLDFRDAGAATASPLAARLFTLQGVAGVFLGRDFITVSKTPTQDWAALKPLVLGAIMDHFTSGKPAVTASAAASHDLDDPIVKQIKEILDHKVRPAVAQDGGDILFDRFEDSVVFLQLRGSCAGCPSSTATLKMGVENMLKHYVPEVREVRQAV